jgi:hypothetical protein
MAKLDGLQTVLDFLKGLQPKIAAQIAKKVLALSIEPLPVDSKEQPDILVIIAWIRVNIGSSIASMSVKI